jgi:hypothetical protein
MTTDDDRMAYLAGEGSGALDDAERAELDDVRALLADPSLWAEPSAGLEDAVVAAISAERGTSAAPRPRAKVRPLPLVGVAAAAAVVLAVVLVAARPGNDHTPRMVAALRATSLAPAAHGQAHFTKTSSGWRIELDAGGLPRLDHGRYYQAWLKDDQGTLVPIGSFNEGQQVVLWAGVSPVDYPAITVTREAADGNQASSGQRVLTGSIVDD